MVDVVVVGPDDQLLMSTAQGKAIRFSESDARSMGRNTSGVKGIRLRKGDSVIGMVVADPDATLLTVCEQGFGKRTWFGPGEKLEKPVDELALDAETVSQDSEQSDAAEEPNSTQSYRTQRRGGGGLMDIKTSKRNGPVIGIVPVTDEDELLMMTARGKIQRIAAQEISIISRNTQGVRIMNIDEDDALTAIVKVPKEDDMEEDLEDSPAAAPSGELASEKPGVTQAEELAQPEPESDDESETGENHADE